MLTHIPRTSRIFIGLLIITLLLTYVAITLSNYQERLSFNYGMQQHDELHVNPTHPTEPDQPAVDTSDWKKYQNPDFPLAFSYPKDWQVKAIATNKAGFYTVTVITPNPNPNINIYISKDSYLGFDGLKTEPYVVDNIKGSAVNENLIGVKKGDYYYTFDGTMAPRLLPEFKALIKTVTFQ